LTLIALLIGGNLVHASTKVAEELENLPIVEVSIPIKPITIDEKIDYYGDMYGVSTYVLHTVIRCESNYNTYALGDSGKSRGLVQIHSGYNPHVSDAEAYDPDFAINFLAENLSKGKGRMWTCWRKNFNS